MQHYCDDVQIIVQKKNFKLLQYSFTFNKCNMVMVTGIFLYFGCRQYNTLVCQYPTCIYNIMINILFLRGNIDKKIIIKTIYELHNYANCL